jgi:extracellular elastinolytic metalloproteinase
MVTPPRSRRRAVLALLAAGAVAASGVYGPQASADPPPLDPLAYGFQGEGGLLAADADHRAGSVPPTAAQRAAVAALGARAQWGPLGSPLVLTRDDAGYLSGPAAGRPVDVARAFLRTHAALFGLTEALVAPDALSVLKAVPLLEGPQLRAKLATGAPYPERVKAPYVVSFSQVYAGAPAGHDGLVNVGLDPDGRVAFVSSTVTGDTRVTNRNALSPAAALLAAARDVKVDLAGLKSLGTNERGAQTFSATGVQDLQQVRLVTIPTPRDGVRLAHEVILLAGSANAATEHEHPFAYRTLVDAQTGAVLYRSNALQHASDGAGAPGQASLPAWKVFANAPAFPRNGVQTPDNRQFWCFAAGPDCQRVLGQKGGKPDVASPYAYDEVPTGGQNVPTFTTRGNNAQTAPSRVSFLTPDVAVSPVSPGRAYDFPFTDQWHKSSCNPSSFASPTLNDLDAATTNLFVMHNRMHDWSYYLGFTEENYNAQVVNRSGEGRANDPEVGNSQAGSIGGGPTFQGRDNANQISLNDGTPGITNQYLWEPLQAGFYAPCTDGAYDMGIVGHEYGHLISNRMTGGPDSNLTGNQASSMGESWSDLMAVEYLNGYGLAPYADENRFSLAPYVTGDKQAGIRNYGMNSSPLNYSNLEYDGNGTTSPHADGEIWNATQYDVRTALVHTYNAKGLRESDKALQALCADGLKPSTACPGNRRWIQMIFDGFLLQPAAASMLDARDAILASNKMRYRGADLGVMWPAFAKRGMGVDATTEGNRDLNAVAGFRNPLSTKQATFRFKIVPTGGGAAPAKTTFYVGAYEARSTPVLESAGGAFSPTRTFEPGTYPVYLTAKGFGHRRLTLRLKPGANDVTLKMRRNLAASVAGGKASGDGGNLELINDETEGTNWGSVEGAARTPDEPETVRGKQVTIDLAGGAHTVREVQVSTANRPALCSGDAAALGCEASREAPYDTGGQSRFAALRSFEISTCDATTGKKCVEAADFTTNRVKRDAYPAGRPRPTAPDLTLRTFPLTPTRATHVRITVLDNQCTGAREYTGLANPSANPLSEPDCTHGRASAAAAGAPNTTTSTSQKKNVRIAELQVFSTP